MLRFVLLVLAVVLPSGLTYRSVCYHTNWSQYRHSKGHFVPEDIDPNLCTHVIYSFAKIVNNEVQAFEWNDESTPWSTGMYERTMALKQQNPNLKIMLGVGGWNMGSSPFTAAAQSDATRKHFATSLLNFIRKHDFDGFDNDWEYPGNRGSPLADKQNNVLLMQEIRRTFDQDTATNGGSRLQLSEAIGIGKQTMENAYDFPALSQLVDFFNVMSYDIHGAFDKVTGHNSPIYPRSGETGDERNFNVDWAVNYILQHGAPADKINLGIPTYGRSFTLNNPSQHGVGVPFNQAGEAGRYTGEKGFISYYEICEKLQAGAQVFDIPEQHAKYLLQGTQWVGFDDVDSVKEKACYAKQRGLGGVMYWALDLDDFKGSTCNQGRYPLINAANSEFQAGGFANCPKVGSNPVTPGPVTYNPVVTNKPITYKPVTYQPVVTNGPVWTPWNPNPITQKPVTQPPLIHPTQPTRAPVSPALVASTSYNCAGRINDFYADPYSCSSFYICAAQNAFKVDCARGLLFNPAVKHCDWAYNVVCQAQQQPATNPPAVTYGPVVTNRPVYTNPPVTQPPPTYAPVTYAPVTQQPIQKPIYPATAAPQGPIQQAPVQCGKTQTGIFPHPTECHKYVQCSMGRRFEMTCPSSLVYNPSLGSCDFQVNVPSCFNRP